MKQTRLGLALAAALAATVACAGNPPPQIGNPGFNYSVPGSFLTVGRQVRGLYGFRTHPGLWIRNVSTVWREDVCRIVARVGQDDLEVSHCAWRDGSLAAITPKGEIQFAYPRADVILVRSTIPGAMVRFEFQHPRQVYDFPTRFGRTVDYFHYNSAKLLVDTRRGSRKQCGTTIEVTPAAGALEVMIQEIHTSDWDGREVTDTFEEAVARQSAVFNEMYRKLPRVPAAYEPARKAAAQLYYSAIVGPRGLMKRPNMLMSNNWMNKTWSWDHAINALALGYHNPDAAWDQFMCMFDRMSADGMLPDMVSDEQTEFYAVKPPVHGWVFARLRKMHEFSSARLAEAYAALTRWTNWWLTRRDFDGNGLCEYLDGCDSGWDNSTAIVFNRPPLETPDLEAFLILQMECLADLAQTLGKPAEAALWTAKSKRMLDALVKVLFDEDGAPRVRRLRDNGFDAASLSLVTRLPLILGTRLPEKCRARMIADIKEKGFITDWGLASESTRSRHYHPDGYWKGPIWGPSTLLAVEGLRACGEHALADEISEKYCRLMMKSGFSENFDAKTGDARRDPAYTWTASVFLVLAHELDARAAGAR